MKRFNSPPPPISLLLLILLIFIFVPLKTFAEEETLTLTTFYPIPYVVYTRLKLYPDSFKPTDGSGKPLACPAEKEGEIYYYGPGHKLYVCSGSPSLVWQEAGTDGTGEGFWAKDEPENQANLNIHNTNTGNVGLSSSNLFNGSNQRALGPSGYLSTWYGQLRNIPLGSAIFTDAMGIAMNTGTFWRRKGRSILDNDIFNTFGPIEIGMPPPRTARSNGLLVVGDLKIINSASRPLLVVRDNGNVGIATDTPTQRLHIAGNLMIEDGTQRENKVLTSEVQGIARWQSPIGGTGNEVLQGLYGWCEDFDFTRPKGCQSSRPPAVCGSLVEPNQCDCSPGYTKIKIGSKGSYNYYSCYREI